MSRDAASHNVRYHAMDALRAVAMALGVVLHAAVAYMAVPMPGLLWPTDPSPNLAWGWFFDGVFWYLHGFRIPLFFLIAGFFAVMLLETRGPHAFMVHRFKRIVVPLIGSIIVILPLTYLSWGLGLMQSDRFDVTWRQVRKLRYQDSQVAGQVFGLAHLWFLEYLFVICLFVYVFWRLWPSIAVAPGRLRRVCHRVTDHIWLAWWRPAALALPTGLFLFLRPDLYTDFENAWLPDPMGLLHYAVFFVVGMWLYRLRDRLDVVTRGAGVYLALSGVAFIALAAILQVYFVVDVPSAALRLAIALSAALFAWLSVFGYLGVFLRAFDSHRPIVRYCSDAAYWVYLSHLPIVVLVQVGLVAAAKHWGVAIHPIAQFLIVLTTALALTMLTYRYFIRYTIIGTWLNGPRARPRTAQPDRPADVQPQGQSSVQPETHPALAPAVTNES